MTTTHELAKRLLEWPNMPVILAVACPRDTVFGTDSDGKPTDITIQKHKDEEAITLSTFVPEGSFGWEDLLDD